MFYCFVLHIVLHCCDTTIRGEIKIKKYRYSQNGTANNPQIVHSMQLKVVKNNVDYKSSVMLVFEYNRF